jgi:hypothetical protein
MAGNANSGGFRPDAPQNNPANVNPFGGNGQSGTQALKPMSGLPYGQNQATEDIGRSAALAGNPVALSASGPSLGGTQKPMVGLFDEVQPDEQDSGMATPLPPMMTPQIDNVMQVVQTLYLQDPTNQDLKYVLETAQDQGRI